MSGEPTVPAVEIREAAASILAAHWRPAGYAVPNASVYPFQWLWDSCFHAVVWAHLGQPEKAVTELAHVFRNQDDVGFVPHIDYEADPDFHADFWGRRGASTITQPPMYGHAVAELTRCGFAPPAETVERAIAGLRFLLERRARDPQSGLITIVHPWESGADDSPRWDHWRTDAGWFDNKGRLMETIQWGPTGAPLANPGFGAAPAGFNALVAFNAMELVSVCGATSLRDDASALAQAIATRWDRDVDTWADAGPSAETSGRVRTLDALLPTLCPPPLTAGAVAEQALVLAVDDAHYGGHFGPAGVHRDEPSFAPKTYWRGAAWPQLTYLLWVAARRAGRDDIGGLLSRALVAGAQRSGFAEYWDPDDGVALGARPQSWTTLAAVVVGTNAKEARSGLG